MTRNEKLKAPHKKYACVYDAAHAELDHIKGVQP